MPDVFEQNPPAELHAQLHILHQVLVADFHHLDALLVFFTEVLDVLVCLRLRVDHKRPAAPLVNDDTVFSGRVVLRQPADVP